MASKKRAIEARMGHPSSLQDDIGKALGKAVGKQVQKRVSKAVNDVVDPKYAGKVYGKGGRLTKDYKDYVMRNSKGMF
jgi:hypothetical protein